MTTETETVEGRIARLGIHDISTARTESLTIAHPIVSDEIFARLAGAPRLSRGSTIVLPHHRYELLSRGKGWARRGSGNTATWGEREPKGYRVGPGRWIVHGSDGFSRAGDVIWSVHNIVVGDKTWTIAQ